VVALSPAGKVCNVEAGLFKTGGAVSLPSHASTHERKIDMDYYKCEKCGEIFDEFEMNYRAAQIDKKCWCRACREKAEKTLQVYDAGEINGMRLTYVNGNVFATPARRKKGR
jgi:hypothetical protein